MNGGSHPISPSKQPKMPQVKEECEPPSEQLANMMNGHHNTDDNSQFNGTGNFFEKGTNI